MPRHANSGSFILGHTRNPRKHVDRHAAYLFHRKKTIHQNWIRQIKAIGCTPELYNELLADQKGSCALCHKPNVKGKKLAVDHDHKTGIIRGLLCNRCNAALGALGDNVDSITEVLNYLCRIQK